MESSQTHLQALSAISLLQETLQHHCHTKSISVWSSTGKLPFSIHGCEQIAAKQILGFVSIFTVSPIMPFVFTTSVTLGNLVMNPTFLSHKTWSVCCSQHIWDLISTGMSPDIVPWTRQKVTRIKVSLEHWIFQIVKVSRTQWKSRIKKPTPFVLTSECFDSSYLHYTIWLLLCIVQSQILRTLFYFGKQ